MTIVNGRQSRRRHSPDAAAFEQNLPGGELHPVAPAPADIRAYHNLFRGTGAQTIAVPSGVVVGQRVLLTNNAAALTTLTINPTNLVALTASLAPTQFILLEWNDSAWATIYTNGTVT